ncbi:MAG: CotH kinase family protein [Lachnospiraceae bacterium]|nr:CotH kinase family protein [Lachnospiraceae bacterium]
MKQIRFLISILILFFAAPLNVHAAALPDEDILAEEESAADTAVFTCIRKNGDIFHSFIRGDGVHVLFLPADFPGGNLTVSCASSGKMKTSSIGRVNPNAGTISGNLPGRCITISYTDGSKLRLLVQTSSLPSLAVTLDGVTLDEVHLDKSIKHPVALTTLYDPENSKYNLSVTGGEFKGRGNTSWVCYDKKGFQIKFPQDVSLLGMEPAKKWILLGNASDPSLLRNKLAFDAAKAFPFSFSPDNEFADLWINGDYRGLYLISEKIEINRNRLALSSGNGVLVEYDNVFYEDEDLWFADDYGEHFALKDSENENPDEDFAVFEEKIRALDAALKAKDWEAASGNADMESIASMLILNEYYASKESATTSFFWYLDGEKDKLHAGPAWDFDTCMQDDSKPEEIYVFQNKYYKYLLDFDEFEDVLRAVWEQAADVLLSSADSQDALGSCIADSALINYMRFEVLGTSDAKGHTFLPSWEENLSLQREWLVRRAEKFGIGLICSKRRSIYLGARVSDNSRYADLTLRSSRALQKVVFRVSTDTPPSSKTIEYEAELSENGVWEYRVDLMDFTTAGNYHAEAYVNGSVSQPYAKRDFSVQDLPPMNYKYGGINYRSVFNPLYYAENNPDITAGCGRDSRILFRHFLQHGMKEGRRGNLLFDPEYYAASNLDLKETYGSDDFTPYYLHYITTGRKDGRQGAQKINWP